MSAPQNTVDANAILMQSVAVPASFEKIASIVGYTPSSAEDAAQVLNLGDLVKAATDLFLSCRKNSTQATATNIVKAAAETAFEQAGIGLPSQTSINASDFLKDDMIRQASMLLVKAAMGEECPKTDPTHEPDRMVPEPGKKKSKEEEEEEEREAAAAAAAAAATPA